MVLVSPSMSNRTTRIRTHGDHTDTTTLENTNAVKLDLADAVIAIGEKGVLLSITIRPGPWSDTCGSKGPLSNGRRGASLVGRGRSIPLQQFMATLEEAVDRPEAASKPKARKASQPSRSVKSTSSRPNVAVHERTPLPPALSRKARLPPHTKD